jgi:RimJ/RimL family protein N-acetyltransferase
MASTASIASARLAGECVCLRPVRPEDAPAAFELLQGRESILRWLLWKGPSEVSELERSFAHWRRPFGGGGDAGAEADTDAGADYLFAIEERASGDFVGTIGVRFGGHPEMGDMGYWIAEHVWDRGYATEAILLATAFCFRHVGAASLSAWVFVGNDASRRALEKNGFAFVRTAHQKVERDGIARDEWYLVLLREDWEAARGDWSPALEEIARA